MDLYTNILPILGALVAIGSLFWAQKSYFQNRAILYSRVKQKYHLNRKVNNAPGTLVYKLNDKEISGDTFLVSFDFSNIGNVDITKNHFIDTEIAIQMPVGFEIISVDSDPKGESGIPVELRFSEDKVYVKWDILKKQETLLINVICFNSSTDIDESKLLAISINPRLENVTTRNTKIHRVSFYTGAVFWGALFALVVLCLVYWVGMPFEPRTVFTISGIEYVFIHDMILGSKVCEAYDTHRWFSNCRPLEGFDVSSIKSTLEVKKVKIGVSINELLSACFITSMLFLGFAVVIDRKNKR